MLCASSSLGANSFIEKISFCLPYLAKKAYQETKSKINVKCRLL